MSAITLDHYLVVAACLFALGVVTVVARRNAIGILLGVELILNAANLNFVAFNRFLHGRGHAIDGQLFALFVIVLAAAEAAVALAIVLALHRNFRSIDVEETRSLRG